jgi:hypothetical protein
MDIIIGIIIAILFLVGSANKKKREQEQRAARARTMQPPVADPRFPPAPSVQETPMPPFSGEVSPGFEGELVTDLPVSPAPVQQRAQVFEGSSSQTEGRQALGLGSISARVAAHMEPTQGRHATLTHSLNVHAHTEGSMGGDHTTGRRAVIAREAREPEERQGIAPNVITRLRNDPDAVAEGVILSEILGKPKALRRV